MRKLFARLIVAFAHLVTFPFFGPVRRADARIRADSMLVNASRADVATDMGRVSFCGPDLRATHSQAAVFQIHEPDTMRWIREFPEGAVLWDIGAHMGAFALYSSFKPMVRVLAFEPGAGSFAVRCGGLGNARRRPARRDRGDVPRPLFPHLIRGRRVQEKSDRGHSLGIQDDKGDNDHSFLLL